MRISPCDRMMTKYWYNDYVVTHSETRRLNVETIEQDIHNAEVMIINNTLFCSMIVPIGEKGNYRTKSIILFKRGFPKNIVHPIQL